MWRRAGMRSSRRRLASSARATGYYSMIEKVEAPDPNTVVFRLKYATAAFLPALADPYAFIYKKEILDRDPHWYERTSWGPARSCLRIIRPDSRFPACATPITTTRDCRISRASLGFTPTNRRRVSARSEGTGQRSSSAAFRRQPAMNSSPRSATRSRFRRATGTAAIRLRRTTSENRSTMCGCAER